MNDELKLDVYHSNQLTTTQLGSIQTLCNRAYEEDLTPLFNTFTDATHVVGTIGESIISHAMWVTRWLQPGNGPYLRTAYVEMVATEPHFQRRGFAAAVMRRLAEAISDFDLGGLCPAEPELYARLGWIFWRGPLFIRTPEGLNPTPDAAYWNPTRIVSDNRLAAFESDASEYIFALPSNEPATIQVTLLFRRAFKTLMDQKGWEVADIVMEQESLSLSAP